MSYALAPGGEVTVPVAVDHGQFIVRDPEAELDVALHDEKPEIDIDQCDHLAEAGFSIRSGRLHLYGPEDTNSNESSVVVPSGTYSVIVSGSDFDTTNEHGDEGADTYALHLWPGPLLGRRVLKDGFAWLG